jgi:hypothetical protein
VWLSYLLIADPYFWNNSTNGGCFVDSEEAFWRRGYIEPAVSA